MYELIKHSSKQATSDIAGNHMVNGMRFNKSAALLKKSIRSLELNHDGELIEYRQRY